MRAMHIEQAAIHAINQGRAMNDFDQLVKEADKAKRELSPAAIEKKNLQPVRSEAEQLLAELNAAIEWAQPRIAECLGRAAQAAQHGIRHSVLDRRLDEANKIAHGGYATIKRDIIERIENLTDFDVYHGIHIRIPARLTNARAFTGELRRLVGLAEGQDMDELTEIFRQRVGSPGLISPVPEKREDLTSITDFKV